MLYGTHSGSLTNDLKSITTVDKEFVYLFLAHVPFGNYRSGWGLKVAVELRQNVLIYRGSIPRKEELPWYLVNCIILTEH